jgi:DNA-binding MarR family transcriptional regulator
MRPDPDGALDGLLETLQRGQLSPLELRLLLALSMGDRAQGDLADALSTTPGAISRATRRLARRGLVRQRFERGPESGFVLALTPSGALPSERLAELLARLGAREERR